MNNIKLSIATTDYDHFRDFRTGAVCAEGIDHTWSMLGHHEVLRDSPSIENGMSPSYHLQNFCLRLRETTAT